LNFEELDIEAIADDIMGSYSDDEIRKFLEERDYSFYQNDPVGFIQKELDVKYLPDALVKVAESVRDNEVTVAQSCTAYGKTWLASALAVWIYRCYPNSQILTVAAPPERNLEKLWQEIKGWARRKPKLFAKDRKLSFKICEDLEKFGDDEGDDKEKHMIYGIVIPSAGDSEEKISKFSGYHAPYQFFILDEGDAVPDEIYIGMDGCQSGEWARMLIMYNPKRRLGRAYELIQNGRANVISLNAFNHPNVVTGENLIDGAVTRKKTVQRIIEWTAPLIDGEEIDRNCFEVPKFLEGTIVKSGSGQEYPPLQGGIRRITNYAFSYVVLGVYPPFSANQLINEEWINQAIVRWKLYKAQYGDKATEGILPLLGMDVADEGADYCCICKKYGSFVAGFERWGGIDTDLSSSKTAIIYANVNAYQINIESDGIGAAIPPKLGRYSYFRCPECQSPYHDQNIIKCPKCKDVDLVKGHINVKKVYVSAPSEKKCEIGRFWHIRDELWWAVREWLRTDPSAMLPDNNDLKRELLVPEFYEDPSNGRIRVTDKKGMRKELGRSPDWADSLIQCFYNPSVPRIRMV